MKAAGGSGGRIVAHVIVAISAAHGPDALILRAADDARDVDAASVALERRIQLMAIEAARMLENGGNLVPRGQAGGLIGWLLGSSRAGGAGG